MTLFLPPFSLFGWLKKGSCQLLAKVCAQILVNRLQDWAQKKSEYVNWLAQHDLTNIDLAVKLKLKLVKQRSRILYWEHFQQNIYIVLSLSLSFCFWYKK